MCLRQHRGQQRLAPGRNGEEVPERHTVEPATELPAVSGWTLTPPVYGARNILIQKFSSFSALLHACLALLEFLMA